MRPAIVQFELGPMMNFVYLVADETAGLCAVVDPGWDAAGISKQAGAKGWRIEKILLTHSHFDHAGAVDDLVALTKAPVYVHRDDMQDVGIPVTPTQDGTVIEVGAVKIKCIHTPGHTPGSQCFLTEGAVFTGDTLFIEGCGRVDLPGSDPRNMLSSLRKLASLPLDVVVYAGHDYGGKRSATIGELLKSNQYLRGISEEMLF